MSGPTLAREKKGRRYYWPPDPGDGKYEMIVPSVTTILDQKSKPALVNWAAKEVATFAVENILSWENLASSAAIDLLKRAPWRERDQAADRGTAVHAILEVWANEDEENPPSVHPDLISYVAAGVEFLREHIDEVLYTEATIFNRQYQYAGTADLIVRLKDGRIAMADWKTSKRIYPETAMQLCAYARGDFIGTDDGQEIPLPAIDLGVAIRLSDTGNYEAKVAEFTPRLWRTFTALRSVQLWTDDYEANAFTDTWRGKGGETQLILAGT